MDPEVLRALQLIQEFKIRPHLWDSSQDNYYNKNRKNRQLGIAEIAAILKTSDQDVERRWRSMRTIYRRKLKEVLFGRRRGRQVKIKWAPYSYMDEFLHRVCVKEDEEIGPTDEPTFDFIEEVIISNLYKNWDKFKIEQVLDNCTSVHVDDPEFKF